MRVYFEKPRTTVGWKGLINDPGLDGSFDVNRGLHSARRLLLDILALGLPVGCEFLDPITPQYISDTVSWGSIGARTAESQVHRQLSSGLSMPIGIKNSTGGDVQAAVDAVAAAAGSHVFPGIATNGLAAIFETTGNSDCHVILRGSTAGPNYDAASVADALARLERAGLPGRVIVDASHGNSGKDHLRQPIVASEIADRLAAGEHGIVGVMLESFLVAGTPEARARRHRRPRLRRQRHRRVHGLGDDRVGARATRRGDRRTSRVAVESQAPLSTAADRIRDIGRAVPGPRTMRARATQTAQLAPAILQTAVAASLAWVIASEVIGHPNPFFAPVGAIIALGVVLTARARRAVEIVVGVSLGVLVADLIVIALGSGTLQIALVVTLAMSFAVLSGGSRVLVGQAATSAALVATIDVPTAVSLARPVDALVGGVTALAVGLLLLPLSPKILVHGPLAALAPGLADTIDRARAALEIRDESAALDALEEARALDPVVARYTEAAAVAAEVSRLSPLRRRQRALAARHVTAATHLDLAVRNVRVLSRAAVRAVGLEASVPPVELEALGSLAEAVRELPDELGSGRAGGAASTAALRAAELSTAALEQTGNLSLSVLTGVIRSAAADLLSALGIESPAARDAVRAAADPAGGDG